jgi:hypothetical protein
MARSFPPQVAGRLVPELLIHEWRQPFEGPFIAVTSSSVHKRTILKRRKEETNMKLKNTKRRRDRD